MKKYIFLFMSLFFITLCSMDSDNGSIPMDVGTTQESDFVSKLPPELSLEVLSPLILDSSDFKDALKKNIRVI